MGLYWLLLDLSNIYPFTGGDSSKSTLFCDMFFVQIFALKSCPQIETWLKYIIPLGFYTIVKLGTLRGITPSKWINIAHF